MKLTDLKATMTFFISQLSVRIKPLKKGAVELHCITILFRLLCGLLFICLLEGCVISGIKPFNTKNLEMIFDHDDAMHASRKEFMTTYFGAAGDSVINADFKKAASILESNSGALTEVANRDLDFWCGAMLQMRNYPNVDRCIKEMSNRVKSNTHHFKVFDKLPESMGREGLTPIEFDLVKSKETLITGMDFAFGRFNKILNESYENIGELIERGDINAQTPDNYICNKEDGVGVGVLLALTGKRTLAERCVELFWKGLENARINRDSKISLGYGRTHSMSMQEHEDIYFLSHGIPLAKTHMALGQYKKAIAIMKRANYLSLVPVFALQKNFIMGKSLFELGHYNEAEKIYKKMLDFHAIESNGDIYWVILSDYGEILEYQGNTTKAEFYYRKAIDLIEQQRSGLTSESRKMGFVADKQNVYRLLIELLYKRGDYIDVFEFVERAKSRALVDMLASKRDFSGADAYAVGSTVNNLLDELETAETAVFLKDMPSQGTRAQRHSRALFTKQKIADYSSELASLVTVSAIKVTEIQRRLRRNETIVEYYYQDDVLLALLVTSSRVYVKRLNVNGILKDVQQFRQVLQKRNRKNHQTIGLRLYNRLFAPLEQHIPHNRIILIAHGVLHHLPFAALWTDRNTYLLDKYHIRHLSSASIIEFLQDRKQGQSGKLLVFGNPTKDLPYSQKEAVSISKSSIGSVLLLRSKATETALKKMGRQFKRIHFASHGEFNVDTPLQSGLLLSADKENNGVLTVNELYSLHLNADLVTLSACQTAMGKIKSGDDVIGLTRGFLYAGTSSIVSSLWDVDDRATSDLMTHFYHNLKTHSKVNALRLAQLSIKKSYKHPYYWAAFQLTGRAE